MNWTILIFIAALWLVSPIILLIALIVTRRQLHETQRLLAVAQAAAKSAERARQIAESLPRPLAAAPERPPLPFTLEKPTPVSSPPQPLIKPPISASPALQLEPLPEAPVALPLPEPQPEPPAFTPPPFTPPPEPPTFAPPPHPRKPERVAWQPTAPNPLERALHTLSGWPKLIAPFLMQNIGWFIGGFCFVAGALFLIANTSGFINALAVFGSLVSVTAFLLWAGYQFRRQRPELVIASSMLLTLSMLLAPLDLAVAVRLINASGGDGLLLIVSLLITAATLAAFVVAATLSSALLDRALQDRYPTLLTALAAMQLAVPLAAIFPDWRVLAGLDLVLLGLLAYSLHCFVREWLRRLFVEQRLTTYYAAGLLVYAATVSFVHLSWAWPQSLPDGSTGPLLMVLCGLLFMVDAAFKDWVDKYTVLSRFSFALYALSAVAVAMAVQNTPAVLLTLALGAALYGWVTWRYQTLPPLYLLLGCVAGLYGFSILTILTPAWHSLASVPGLLALLALSRWASSRSRAMALQGLVVFGALLIGLTSWSLVWSEPGWLGFGTGMMAAGLAYAAIRLALTLPNADPRWSWADAGVALLATVAIAYLPSGLPLRWEVQTAFGWLALATGWAGLGLQGRRRAPISRSVFIAAALGDIALALTLAGVSLWPDWLGRLDLILLLIVAGGLLLWLSLGLRQQPLFYGVLAVAAAIGVLIKQSYFPDPGSGWIEFVLALGLWGFLWRLDWRLRIRTTMLADAGEDRLETGSTLIRTPLEQAMALLWAVGLTHLSLRLLEGTSSTQWPLVAGWAAISGILLLGRFHLFHWFALPALLGLAGVLVGLEKAGLIWPWLGASAVLYGWLVWRISVIALAKPTTQRIAGLLGFTVPGGAGGCRQVEEGLHGFALLIAASVVAVSPALALLGWPAWQLWPALAASLLLFVMAGRHYQSAPHAYAALITVTLSVWLIRPDPLFGLNQPILNTLLSLSMAVAALWLETGRVARLAFFQTPLLRFSSLLYALALAGGVLAALAGEPGLPLLLILLGIALFPVSRPWSSAADWRGIGLALLLGALTWSIAAQSGASLRDIGWIAIAWGYALWLAGNLLLPRWNTHWPDWAVAPGTWPLFGLIGVLRGAIAGFAVEAWPLAVAVALLTPYLFLLLRNSAWIGLAWLAVAALTLSGLLAFGGLEWNPLTITVALLWLNLLWLLIPLWRRYGQQLAGWLQWRQHGLEPPLFWTPFVALTLLLADVLSLESLGWWYGIAPPDRLWALVGVTALLTATAAHACRLHQHRVQAHTLLVAGAATMGAMLLAFNAPPGSLPLVIALWNGGLLLVWRYGPHRFTVWREALKVWLNLLPVAGLALLWATPQFDWGWCALTLGLLGGTAFARGVWQADSFWLKVGLILLLAGSYALWLTGANPWTILSLGPWYALQTCGLLAASRVARSWINGRLDALTLPEQRERLTWLYDLEAVLTRLESWLLLLTLLWIGVHSGVLLMTLTGMRWPIWYFGVPADPLAFSATLLLLIGWAGKRAWRQPDESNGLYAAALLLGLLAVYLRLIILGLTPITPWDSAALLIAAFAAFLLHQFTALPPFYRLALLLPILAILTTPWQLASPWTGGTLLTSAVLYLSLAGTLRNPLPLYLGILALNGAIYLWAPQWAAHYGLWQFYIIPAAASGLVLAHLHRQELRPKVLNGVRLAALSALYAGVGLDVFLRHELWIFVLALTLAMTGVILGIALRIRAFLYTGVAFLILNVLGQLLQFYPEQGFSRALILIGLGAVITAGMVFFNLRREAILQRIRIIRADLAEWE
ncbi:MAG: hypothetical protein EKK68_04605 [Candidatus Competibacteraceae bacterium]|nr:MAG: hypothetical protein EKK68_04605 [Candidatus Competibacteraceae bacterium]